MGLVGGLLRAFKGDDKFKLERTVKDPKVQQAIDTLLSAYETDTAKGKGDIESFLSKYSAGNERALGNANQEAAAIDRYYNGGIESQLNAFRTQEKAARNEGLKLAQDYLTKRQNVASLNRGLGLSGYQGQQALGESRKLNTENLLADTAAQRNDFNALESAKLGLAGKRSAILDAALNRYLKGVELRGQANAANAGLLGGINGLNQSNSFFGLSKERNGMDRWADAFDAIDNSIMNAASVFGSVVGGVTGMGGGGGAIGGAKKAGKVGNASGGWTGGVAGGSGGLDAAGGWGQQYENFA